MPRDAEQTRQRILDAAQQAVLRRGFSATSVDDIHTAAGVSRGTFFYHFPSKDDLARALVARYAEADRAIADDLMARAEKLATDPLQQALIFIALYEELFQETGAAEAGCLFASYSYEAGLFDEVTHEVVVTSIEHFRTLFAGKLREAMERHEMKVPDIDPDVLAELAFGVVEGAFILSRTFGNPRTMVDHLRHFRRYLELLFGVAGDESPRP